MDIDPTKKVKPWFTKELFDWFARNGIDDFLNLIRKTPSEKGSRKKTKTYGSIKRHIESGSNMGVLIPRGVVVLDVDAQRDGFADLDRLLVEAYGASPSRPSIDDIIKSTFAVRTGRGGVHLYYRHDPAKRTRGSLKGYKGIDLKTSANQYVVAPGGVHENGNPYTIENWPDELADLPAELAPLVLDEIRDPLEPSASSAHPLWGAVESQDLEALLAALDPKDFRSYLGGDSSWLNLLAAVHHTSGGDPEAMGIFADWSSRDPLYTEDAHKAVERRWSTFKDRRASGYVATVESLLHKVRDACQAAELLALSDETHGKALAVCHGIAGRLAALDLEPLVDTEAGNLLAWISSPDGDCLVDDPAAIVEVIAKIAELPEITWHELSEALSRRTDGRHAAQKIERLVQKEATKKQRESKATYAEIVASIAADTKGFLSDDPKNIMIPPSGDFYRYDSGYWQEMQVNEIDIASWESAKLVESTIKKYQKPLNKYAADAADCVVRELSTIETGLYEKRALPNCVNLENGTIWFSDDGSYELRPHRREDLLTTKLPIRYDKKAKCPSFITMLKQIFQSIADKYGEQEQDAFISHFFELLGYIIQSNKNHPVMIFWQGRGKTGKSTLAKFVKRLVGDKATLDVKIKDFFDPKNTHNTTALEGKLLVLDQDMNTSTILSDGIMKNISENCELDVNPKNQKHKKITVHTTVLAITNVTVYSNDASDGFKRRIFAAYFERPMGDLADSKIPSQAAQEMPGILNAALDGYARLRKRGDFLLPQSALDFRDRFVMASHSVLDFWGNLGKQPLYGHKIETSKVYSKYCQFMIEDGEGKTHSKQTFIDALAGNGVKIDRERLTGWTIDLGSENKKGI